MSRRCWPFKTSTRKLRCSHTLHKPKSLEGCWHEYYPPMAERSLFPEWPYSARLVGDAERAGQACFPSRTYSAWLSSGHSGGETTERTIKVTRSRSVSLIFPAATSLPLHAPNLKRAPVSITEAFLFWHR